MIKLKISMLFALVLMVITAHTLKQDEFYYQYSQLDNDPHFKDGNAALDSLFRNKVSNELEIEEYIKLKVKVFIDKEGNVTNHELASKHTDKEDLITDVLVSLDEIYETKSYQKGIIDDRTVAYERYEYIEFYPCKQGWRSFTVSVGGNNQYIPEIEEKRDDLASFFSSNYRVPDQARAVAVSGQIDISFEINEEGKIENIRTPRKEAVGGGCEKEAERVMKKAADEFRFKIAEVNGCKVTVKHQYSIYIGLGTFVPNYAPNTTYEIEEYPDKRPEPIMGAKFLVNTFLEQVKKKDLKKVREYGGKKLRINLLIKSEYGVYRCNIGRNDFNVSFDGYLDKFKDKLKTHWVMGEKYGKPVACIYKMTITYDDIVNYLNQ